MRLQLLHVRRHLLWGGVKTTVSAADDGSITSIKVNDFGSANTLGELTLNTAERKLIFTPDNSTTNPKCSELLFCVGTLIKNKKEEELQAIKAGVWDVYDISQEPGNDEVIIDLSKLSNTKDNYLMIKVDNLENYGGGEEDELRIIKIPAADKVTAASYNPVKKEITVETGERKSELSAADAYEYRTSSGSWNKGKDVDGYGKASGVFEEYQYQGASLYVRTPGSSCSRFLYCGRLQELAEVDYWKTADPLRPRSEESSFPKEYEVYESDSFPGKEVKLTIPKQANPPALKVNYVNGKVTIPQNAEYRLVTQKYTESESVTEIFQVGEIVKNNTNAAQTIDIHDIFDDNVFDSGRLEVRIAENAAKKKAASKWARTMFFANFSWGTKHIIKKDPANKSIDAVRYRVSDNSVDEGLPNYNWDATNEDADEFYNTLWAEYGTSIVKGKEVYNTILFKNSCEGGFDIIIAGENQDVEDALKSSKNIKKIKPAVRRRNEDGDIIEEKNQILKLKNVEAGSKIYIRRSGDSKNKRWTTSCMEFGIVQYPANSAAQ